MYERVMCLFFIVLSPLPLDSLSPFATAGVTPVVALKFIAADRFESTTTTRNPLFATSRCSELLL